MFYLVMVSSNEPKLQLCVAASLLCSDELQQVFMLHPTQAVDLVLGLPRLTFLKTNRGGEHKV